MEWFGFWIFLAVCVIVEACLYDRGHDGVLFAHKTEAEKQLQAAAIAKRKCDAGL